MGGGQGHGGLLRDKGERRVARAGVESGISSTLRA
jgi:hypothetical protein